MRGYIGRVVDSDPWPHLADIAHDLLLLTADETRGHTQSAFSDDTQCHGWGFRHFFVQSYIRHIFVRS